MRKIKWIGFFVAVIVAVLIIWTPTSKGSAQGQQSLAGWDCNMQNISGDYVVAAFGTVTGPNALGLPTGTYNSAATSTLDGFGNFTITPTTFVNGVMVQDGTQTITGVYTVGPKCTTDFFDQSGQVELTRAYGTAGHITVQGVSMVPGTNITYLIKRK